MKKIYTKSAPEAVGPYSQAVISNGFIFLSGQIGVDPITGELSGATVEAQAEQVIKNLTSVLDEGGSSLNKVVKTTCFLKNINDFQKFNDIYAKYFTHNPARATVEVSGLPKNALVEIEAIAEIPNDK